MIHQNMESGETTMLAEEAIFDVSQANDIFGGLLSDGSVPIVLLPGRFCWCMPFFTVPEGCYAMIQKFGADYDDPVTGDVIWSPGIHFAPPWVQVSHLVTKQTFVFNTPVKGCKTADNVTVTIDVTLALRIMGDKERSEDPNLVRTFVYKLTPRGLTQQIKDAQEEAVRALARSVNHTAVYGLRSKETEQQSEMGSDFIETLGKSAPDVETEDLTSANVTEAMKRSLNTQFNKYGVQITDVMITNVRLPPDIVRQMQEKTTYASIIAEQKVTQMNELQLLGFREEKETTMQKKREEILAEEAEGIRLSAGKRQELEQIEAETKKLIAELKEQEKAAVHEIETLDRLEVGKIKAQQLKLVEEIKAETEALVSDALARKSALIAEQAAEVERIKTRAAANADKIMFRAEEATYESFRDRREHELSLEQIKILGSLSANKNVVISGKANEGQKNNFLAEMLVAQSQSQVLFNVKV